MHGSQKMLQGMHFFILLLWNMHCAFGSFFYTTSKSLLQKRFVGASENTFLGADRETVPVFRNKKWQFAGAGTRAVLENTFSEAGTRPYKIICRGGSFLIHL